ncbi:TetR family transcriptional regulator [Variovorax sp. H27-G14]|uniref:TetR/AcrR family transcriptional regulator n=1 Tax=Variovorax sp. H27-G14 TaxID=3111914 RepID=UPI0038FBF693
MARHTKAEAALTRTRLLEAALAAFAQDGVRATTLEAVAARAGVTRGAVYWHFADKAALVAEAVDAGRWPLDIGADVSAYQAHAHPLRLLREQLCAQVARCMNDPMQWRSVQLALCLGVRPELPPGAQAHVEHTMARSVVRLVRVMKIAQARAQLRGGLTPSEAGRCLHAMGVGVLSEWARGAACDEGTLALCFELFLTGASAQGRPARE